MRLPNVPISALSIWAKSNEVELNRIAVQRITGKGWGLVAEEGLPSRSMSGARALLRVPKDLILSVESLKEYARGDKHFQELLTAAGGFSHRGDVMLFLLIQMTLISPDCSSKVGVSNAWTEYTKMLPPSTPLPTTWTEEQRKMLKGTSLQSPLSAKDAALHREFEYLKERTSIITWCQEEWWESGVLCIDDWRLLDAWYRSRVLQLPCSGESMVPGVDMVNHSHEPKVYYEEEKNGDIILLLGPELHVAIGEEMGITYGPEKSAAEMTFSYGFVDDENEIDSMVLELPPLSDDPLGEAKVAAFKGRPIVELKSGLDSFEWISQFAFLMCVNEEDGLKIEISHESGSSKGRLQVFWQGKDVTETTDQFQDHIKEHTIYEVLVLRAVALIVDRLREQHADLSGSEEMVAAMEPNSAGRDKSIWTAALQLRHREALVLRKALGALELQISQLCSSPAVIAYLALPDAFTDMNEAENEVGEVADTATEVDGGLAPDS